MAKNRLKFLYRSFLGLIVFLIIISLVYFSYGQVGQINKESFIVKRPKRQSISSLKEKILDKLVNLLQESSKIIELSAKVQLKLQNNILSFVGNNKNNYLVKNKNIKDLTQIVDYLNKVQSNFSEEKKELESLNNYFNFSIKTKKI